MTAVREAEGREVRDLGEEVGDDLTSRLEDAVS